MINTDCVKVKREDQLCFKIYYNFDHKMHWEMMYQAHYKPQYQAEYYLCCNIYNKGWKQITEQIFK
jgi:hypothetical protein